ncbi:MAG: ferredoxin [Myxococcota bacterium]
MTFLPAEITVSIDGRTTLFEAANQAGLPVGSSCQAEGICAHCGLRILSGLENLSTESPLEKRVKTANRVDPLLRLSCLVRIRGPVTVTADYW